MSILNSKSLRKFSNLLSLMQKGMVAQIWAIKVFQSEHMISASCMETNLDTPSLQASDVRDVQAEFVADPFIITYKQKFYLFFEVFNKGSARGEIGLAISDDGAKWEYQRIVLRESFHLSYPQVFVIGDDVYMLPETSGAGRVLLYKAKQFPFEWEVVSVLFEGNFLDPSIVKYEDKWWIFAGSEGGNLHLFHADQLLGPWMEHPQNPIITNDKRITRPGGRLVAMGSQLFRYTQDGSQYYGNSVRVFKVNTLSEFEYKDEEVSIVLRGTNKDRDWRKDGMHHIDQLMISDTQWLVAVDGQRTKRWNYFAWKLDRIKSRMFS
ncbi:hypothetical protein BC351_27390 [Paenibacillus ferrarius]|uniref:Glucosamine inositolphosphorylceramide transferase 1 N-terminal domain-containing protein n=1 Tax=Paenibacillus ferrarius TaxID=1469647 RepID=A0A1V4HIV3_9BACL|nr:hypothetical protein [Paenibacillus ferrarius]OPH56668.1 hypothetical protein BC351_27390 [Paenibacillus ferrarius]